MLCSDDGYPFRVIPYIGKSVNDNQRQLEFRVAKKLFKVVNDDKWYNVYFDNICTTLVEDLKQQSIPATETMQVNRLLV